MSFNLQVFYSQELTKLSVEQFLVLICTDINKYDIYFEIIYILTDLIYNRYILPCIQGRSMPESMHSGQPIMRRILLFTFLLNFFAMFSP